MKRAILIGAGCDAAGIVVALLVLSPQEWGLTKAEGHGVGTAAIFICALCYYFARRLPPASSWLRSVVGWLIGFWGLQLIVGVALGIFDQMSK